MDPDLELLERWRGGDNAAGEALFARYFDALCGFFATKCNEVEELVQRTLVACLEAKEQFRRQSTFRTYVFTVARHELYHHLRRLRRDQDRLDFSITSVAELITTPATRLARDAERRRIIEALRTLPLEQQTLLELYYWEDMDVAAFDEEAVTRQRRLVKQLPDIEALNRVLAGIRAGHLLSMKRVDTRSMSSSFISTRRWISMPAVPHASTDRSPRRATET